MKFFNGELSCNDYWRKLLRCFPCCVTVCIISAWSLPGLESQVYESRWMRFQSYCSQGRLIEISIYFVAENGQIPLRSFNLCIKENLGSVWIFFRTFIVLHTEMIFIVVTIFFVRKTAILGLRTTKIVVVIGMENGLVVLMLTFVNYTNHLLNNAEKE